MRRNLPESLLEELQVKVLNTGYVELDQQWNYSNISSPFSRIYLITGGEGYILPNNLLYKLKPGYLYLIPSFVLCNYHCTDSLAQYYIHLINQFPTGLNIYDFLSIRTEVKALPHDIHLFERLIDLNQDLSLRHSDPKFYERKNWKEMKASYADNKSHLETIGILKQIFSRFINRPKEEIRSLLQFSNFRKVFQYINLNLHEEIRIENLAKIACYSYDHFIRIFKKTTGMLPTRYINLKRIEKAQILLLTTNLTQNEICIKTGFNNPPYFYRVFQKYVGTTPSKYRKMGGLI